VFDDESKYFKSVSVDLNSHELKKVQFYKNIINHLIERAESSQLTLRTPNTSINCS